MLRTFLMALLGLVLASCLASCAQGVMASGVADTAETRVIQEYRLGRPRRL